MVADPYCLDNLAGKPEFTDTKAALWADLKAELERSGDPRIAGNGDVFETYDYIVDAPHSWAHYLAGDWQPQEY